MPAAASSPPSIRASEEHFDKTFATNVKGVFFTVQKALPLMKAGGSHRAQRIDRVGKRNARIWRLQCDQGGRAILRPTWTNELKDRNIRVNVVSPGPINTPGIDGIAGDPEQAKQLKAGLVSQIPLGRMGEPDEIAKAVVFLVSDDSSFVAGVELFVDGGMIQV